MTTEKRVAKLRWKRHKAVWVEHNLCAAMEAAVAVVFLLLLCGFFRPYI